MTRAAWVAGLAIAATYTSVPALAQDSTPTPAPSPEATAAPTPAPVESAAPTPVATAAPAPTPATTRTSSTRGLESMSLEELLDLKIASVTKFAARASEAPSVVSVTTRQQIRAFGWRTLNDILDLQPGFSPGQDYERPTVVARGLWESWNNNHLLLLIDGVPYNDNETGGAYTWEITPLLFVKSVETIRGPGSALYGSSAMNGVVAVNTLDVPTGNVGSASVRSGDFGARTYDVAAGGSSRLFGTIIGFESFETAGNQYRSFDGSGRTDGGGNLEQFVTRDHRSDSYLFAKIEGRGPLDGLSLQLHNQDWSYETGHGWFWQIPDVGEAMRESRQIASLKYHGGSTVTSEAVVQLQRHNLFHDMRFLPDGAYANYYPAGVTEFLQTHVDTGFARAQIGWQGPRGANLLAGAEQSLFYYSGDDKHYSNANLSDVAGGYPPVTGFQPLGPYYAYVLDKPVFSTGAFAQLTSGEWLGDHAQLTLGGRFDDLWFDYIDVASAGRPIRWKSYQQFSPRVGLVVSPLSDLKFKAMAGRAFRAPAPVELFGANTWALGSNINAIRPEDVTTYELAADWKISNAVTWRTNGYYTEFRNQIAYGSNNALNNLFSHTDEGIESEALYEIGLGDVGRLNGFANVSHVQLVRESIDDATISREKRVTWAPADTAKAGLSFSHGAFAVAGTALYQGVVYRRTSDVATAQNAALRPATVPAWTRFDANLSWDVTEAARLALSVTNIADDRARIVKNGDFPFDYRAPGRRVAATLEVNL